jgi:excisionase family DNA binding protein
LGRSLEAFWAVASGDSALGAIRGADRVDIPLFRMAQFAAGDIGGDCGNTNFRYRPRKAQMKLLTVPEAANILGVKEKTLRDWIWKKKIETVRNGGRYVRITETALINFVEAHTVPAGTSLGRKGASSVIPPETAQAQRH